MFETSPYIKQGFLKNTTEFRFLKCCLTELQACKYFIDCWFLGPKSIYKMGITVQLNTKSLNNIPLSGPEQMSFRVTVQATGCLLSGSLLKAFTNSGLGAKVS